MNSPRFENLKSGNGEDRGFFRWNGAGWHHPASLAPGLAGLASRHSGFQAAMLFLLAPTAVSSLTRR
jgi:hypothetical protein